MFFSRYAKFMFAPDTGADGGVSEAVVTEADNTDYKALYEKEVAERAKLKKSFDATASEIAELKKQSKAKMSEEEKREAELAEERQHWKEMANQLNTMKVETVFAKQGYDEKDYSDLAKKLVEVGGDNAQELAEVFVEFVKKANKNAVANSSRAGIKDSANAMLPKASTKKEEEHTYAKMATESNKLNSTSKSIKDYYSKK